MVAKPLLSIEIIRKEIESVARSVKLLSQHNVCPEMHRTVGMLEIGTYTRTWPGGHS